MTDRIYLDNAATTRLRPQALEAMLPYLGSRFANPSAIYYEAREAKAALAKAREHVASVISADPSEIIFTSGGTEADNWALTAVFEKALRTCDRPHIVSTAIEHHAVLETLKGLEARGASVTYLKPDRDGRIAPEAVREALTKETCLITVMTANNETGTIQPSAEIAEIARERGILFHTDAVQAYGHIPLNTQTLKADLLSISAHKMGGPKGIGALYIRRGTGIGPFLRGGQQERGLRAGTENTAGIAGFGAAAACVKELLEEEAGRCLALRHMLEEGIAEKITGARINGGDKRLPGHINVTFPGLDGESLLIYLDMNGISASAGAACASGSLSPSHVLTAMGLSYEDAHATLRLTLSAETTEAEIQRTLSVLEEGCRRFRGGLDVG